jgi:hypothetical protein
VAQEEHPDDGKNGKVQLGPRDPGLRSGVLEHREQPACRLSPSPYGRTMERLGLPAERSRSERWRVRFGHEWVTYLCVTLGGTVELRRDTTITVECKGDIKFWLDYCTKRRKKAPTVSGYTIGMLRNAFLKNTNRERPPSRGKPSDRSLMLGVLLAGSRNDLVQAPQWTRGTAAIRGASATEFKLVACK